MFSEKTLKNFANLVLQKGVNLQKGQGLEIVCPVEKSLVAEVLTETAYSLGASVVRVRWENEKIERLFYLNATDSRLAEVPKWLIASRNYLLEENFCYVAISAENPMAFSGVPAEKISVSAIAKGKALKKYFDGVMSNGIRWCVVSVPTKDWAKQVFPNAKNPEELLSKEIERAMRLDSEDPVAVWNEHIDNLDRHAQFLNDANFKYIHFKNEKGTDLTVGLAIGHKWQSAKEMAKDGIPFVANMPTEEVFTAPHRSRVDGVLKSALPLSYNGQIIDNFTITFKNGKIESYSAEKGYDTLCTLINTDNGTKRLGEIALIGKNSPIAKSGVLFYNTLFDENASCHLAIGKAYPTTIENGDKLSKTELKKRGVNDSIEHVDFMIGTPDLTVTGIKDNGEKVILFEDGDWVI
jgi:aminopeptidase